MRHDEDLCSWSELNPGQCAHCRGETLAGLAPEVRPQPGPPAVRVWPPRTREHEAPAGEPIKLPGDWAPSAPAGECRCGKPTRDQAFVCDDCCDLFSRALGDVTWLDEQLDVTIAKQCAVPTEGAGKSAEKALPWHEKAADARRTLHGLLAMWCKFCDEERVRHQSPRNGLPEDTLTDMAQWLLWRVDGLALRDIGPEAVDEITDAVAGCHRVIDRRPDRWYAGPCDSDDCPGELYAKARTGVVECRECHASYRVEARREWLLAAAEDRLANAATIARAVSWLGATPLTGARVRKWAERKQIIAKGHDGAMPLYRIGDAIDLLANETNKTSA